MAPRILRLGLGFAHIYNRLEDAWGTEAIGRADGQHKEGGASSTWGLGVRLTLEERRGGGRGWDPKVCVPKFPDQMGKI